MARIRTIKPEFFGDEKLAPLAPIDRLVFLGLVSMADDAGRLLDNVKAIDGFIFPETEDSARDSLATLARLARITRYVSESGQKLVQIANWSKHQKVDHAAKYVLPPPPGEVVADTSDSDTAAPSSRDTRASLAKSSRSDLRPTTNDLRPTTSDLRGLAAARAAFLARFYATASPERVTEVADQLDQVLSPSGVVRPKQGIHAFATAATLERAIGETFQPGKVKKPDAAIVVLLRILTQSEVQVPRDEQGRDLATRAEQEKSAREREEMADRAALDRDLARYAAWAAENPTDAAKIETEVVAELPGPPDNAFLDHARSVKRIHVWQREQRASRAVAAHAGSHAGAHAGGRA